MGSKRGNDSRSLNRIQLDTSYPIRYKLNQDIMNNRLENDSEPKTGRRLSRQID